MNPQAMQNCRQYQTESSSVSQNQLTTQTIFMRNNPSDRLLVKTSLEHVPEYTVWSLFNMICCWFCLSLLAMIMSHKIQEKKRKDDLEGAKDASEMIAILNVFATTIGTIIIIICLFHFI